MNFEALEKQYGLPTGLLAAVAKVESGGNPNAVSPKGAQGMFQIMPATAKELGVNALDPTQAANGAARYLAQNLKRFGSPELALAAYNAGPGNVQKHGGIPPFKETQDYVKRVQTNMSKKSANPFDQFDQQEANPFDQFDAFEVKRDDEPANEPTLKDKATNLAIKSASGLAGSLKDKLDLGYGVIRGLKDIVDTGAGALSALGGEDEQARVKALTEAGKADFKRTHGDNTSAQVGRIGGNVLGTFPVGGVIAKAPMLAKKAPNLAKAIASGGFAAGGAGMATRMLGGGVTAGASTALIDPKDAGTGAAIGAVLPPVLKGLGAAGAAAGKGLRGDSVSDEVIKLAERAKELGIDIPADRITNSRPLNAVASSLNYVPFSGRAATEARMTKQLTRAVSRLTGQDSENITLALRNANKDLGGKFDKTLKENQVIFDKGLFDDVQNVFETASGELGDDSLKPIRTQIQELFKKGESGAIDGNAAYNIKRTLDRLSNMKTPTAYHAKQLKYALMKALDRSLGPEKAAEFAKVREQYGNMLELEKLAQNGPDGELSIARLANMKDINNEPLQEIADIAARFVKPRESAHGAAQRVVAGSLAAHFAGLPALALASGTGRATNMALNSRAAKNFMLKKSGGLLDSSINPGLYRTAPVGLLGLSDQ